MSVRLNPIFWTPKDALDASRYEESKIHPFSILSVDFRLIHAPCLQTSPEYMSASRI